MDIQALLAARTKWQPAPTLSGTAGTMRTANTGTDGIGAGGEIGFDAAGTGQTTPTGGLTGTSNSMVDGASQVQEEPPTAAEVEAARQEVGRQLQMALAIAGIQASPPIKFTLDDKTGRPVVAGDDPRRAEVQKVLEDDPDLQGKLVTLIGTAQQVEKDAAKAGWQRQVNNGTSQKEANRNLANANQQIDKATGFNLDGDDLSLDVTGMGARLMQADPAPPSDDERMWRETMRLTDRTGPSGVTGAAAMARAEEEAAKNWPARIGLRLGGGEHPDLSIGGSASQGAKAA